MQSLWQSIVFRTTRLKSSDGMDEAETRRSHSATPIYNRRIRGSSGPTTDWDITPKIARESLEHHHHRRRWSFFTGQFATKFGCVFWCRSTVQQRSIALTVRPAKPVSASCGTVVVCHPLPLHRVAAEHRLRDDMAWRAHKVATSRASHKPWSMIIIEQGDENLQRDNLLEAYDW